VYLLIGPHFTRFVFMKLFTATDWFVHACLLNLALDISYKTNFETVISTNCTLKYGNINKLYFEIRRKNII